MLEELDEALFWEFARVSLSSLSATPVYIFNYAGLASGYHPSVALGEEGRSRRFGRQPCTALFVGACPRQPDVAFSEDGSSLFELLRVLPDDVIAILQHSYLPLERRRRKPKPRAEAKTGAGEGTRTPNPFRELDPKSSASTNSATPAEPAHIVILLSSHRQSAKPNAI